MVVLVVVAMQTSWRILHNFTLYINDGCFIFVVLLCKLAYKASPNSKNSFQFST